MNLRKAVALIVRLVDVGLWIGFLALVVTVALQVLARNLFGLPLIWTLDVAQLLFSWLIFIGAAVAFHKGAHYNVDIVPAGWTRVRAGLELVGLFAAAIVVYVMLVHGWDLTQIRSTGTIESLNISGLWMFVPIPIGGALILVFAAEAALRFARGERSA